MNYRLDRKKFGLIHSIIIGADEGVYALLSTLNEKELTGFSQDEGIKNAMITSDEGNGKIIIGKENFGKIRIALALLDNKREGSSLIRGNIICVTKFAGIRKNILNSTWNDYSSIDFLNDAPKIIDMKITKDHNGNVKGYYFQEPLMFSQWRVI